MIELVDEAFAIMNTNLTSNSYDDVSKTSAVEIERSINKFLDTLRKGNVTDLGSAGYDMQSAMIYNNIFHALEKVGDHIINVTEAVIGEI